MLNSINKSILTPRITSLPKGLIYKFAEDDVYRLIETKTGNLIGEMIATPEKYEYQKIYRMLPSEKIFRIHLFEIKGFYRRMKWGCYFFNFAKNESYKQGCEGRLSLNAYNPTSPPQIFYKKQGLVAVDKKVDKSLDLYLKNGYGVIDTSPCEMFLPIDTKKNSKDFIKDLKKFFRLKNN